jgi:hypothetical protein
MSAWIHYWTRKTTDREESRHVPGDRLEHTAGNLFRKKGVASGDDVYVVTFYEGDLRIIGSLVVDQIVLREKAEKLLGTTNLWPAIDHVTAQPGSATELRFDARLPRSKMKLVNFVTKNPLTRNVKYDANGIADKQCFRGLREITGGTAKLFDQVLGAPV